MCIPRHLTVLLSFVMFIARFVTFASRLQRVFPLPPFCLVLSRFSRQARVYGSRFVKFSQGAGPSMYHTERKDPAVKKES